MLTLHPSRPLVAARMDTPFDLYRLAVAGIVSVLEVAQEPSAIQYRVLACVARVRTVIHTDGR